MRKTIYTRSALYLEHGVFAHNSFQVLLNSFSGIENVCSEHSNLGNLYFYNAAYHVEPEGVSLHYKSSVIMGYSSPKPRLSIGRRHLHPREGIFEINVYLIGDETRINQAEERLIPGIVRFNQDLVPAGLILNGTIAPSIR